MAVTQEKRLTDKQQEKWCGSCQEVKPISDFCKNKTSKSGLSSWCRKCNRKYRITKIPLHPRKLLSKEQLCINARKRINKWAAKNRDKVNGYRCQRLYKISMGEYNRKFAEQDGKCFICNKTSKKRLAIDHNHKTGQIRGLLCTRCNFVVGLYEKNVIEGVEKYIKLWELVKVYRKIV